MTAMWDENAKSMPVATVRVTVYIAEGQAFSGLAALCRASPKALIPLTLPMLHRKYRDTPY